MHSTTKKLFTRDISLRTDFPTSVLNESWRSSRRRHYNNAFLASLSLARDGANDSARQLVAATKIAQTISRRGVSFSFNRFDKLFPNTEASRPIFADFI